MFLHIEFVKIVDFVYDTVSMLVVCTVFMTCLVSQMIASKYLNDEGETESVLNSEWAKISKYVIRSGVKFSL